MPHRPRHLPARVDRFLRANASNERIDSLEARLLKEPQVEVPLIEDFGPGVYVRTVLMRKGSFIIGHAHKTKHFNNVFCGRARVIIGDIVRVIRGPACFLSEAGVRKVLYIEEDMIWQTVHPTDETDKAKLEELLVIKTPAFQAHEIAKMREQLGLANDAQLLEESAPTCAPSAAPDSGPLAGGSRGSQSPSESDPPSSAVPPP